MDVVDQALIGPLFGIDLLVLKATNKKYSTIISQKNHLFFIDSTLKIED